MAITLQADGFSGNGIATKKHKNPQKITLLKRGIVNVANKCNIGKEIFEQNSASSFVLKTIKSLKQAQERRDNGLKEQ